jgi:hypothetical protein
LSEPLSYLLQTQQVLLAAWELALPLVLVLALPSVLALVLALPSVLA